MINVFSSGGGTQSCAIAALIVQGKLPKPDYAVIADTGRERKSVWDYHQKHIVPALASIGLEIHKVAKEDFATVDLWTGKKGETFSLPAFTNQTVGAIGKLPTMCSNEWKLRVIQRFLRDKLDVQTSETRRWIGFSLDEVKRINKMVLGADYKAGRILFPLVTVFPVRRYQSIKIATEMFREEPPRSSCWMCPNRHNDEWREMKENSPEEFAMACELEKEAQKIDPFVWLHESCIPLGEVDFTKSESDAASLFCDSGNCFV